MRPEVGTQAQFRKKKPAQTYRYDSSLSPALEWDGQNPAREAGDALIRRILDTDSLDEAKSAAEELRALGRPFLDWSGKGERLSFDVPTLPLFVHERLSTKAILETLGKHRRDRQVDLFDLFGDPQHSITDQVLRAYEHRDRWVNRIILGDSLVVMNSLLHYEGLGGQVQMIYIDPPYGVKFGSNFQPFVRKREVRHNDDEDMTREPEMVQAYRDTWELGVHSYLTYLRDRLFLARELLAPSGSVFVQISDENLHHVRELMDEVFGPDNFVVQIAVQKTGSQTGSFVQQNADYLLWYTKEKALALGRFRPLFARRRLRGAGGTGYTMVQLPDGTDRPLSKAEIDDLSMLPQGARIWSAYPLTSDGHRPTTTVWFEWQGRKFHPGKTRHWGITPEKLRQVGEMGRLAILGNQVREKRFFDEFPIVPITAYWDDVGGVPGRIYAVQTSARVVKRCMLMTTDPGDLVLDPTCGSGTTAYVAEQWGRRWITIDTSRVPLALARQRLLTATFPWYELKDEDRGPGGGFVYQRKQNKGGEEVGGIVPHVTLKSIANDEPPAEEILVDRPEKVSGITRVSGPFCVEATIPTPVDWEADGVEDSGAPGAETYGAFVDRMLEVLRKSPALRLDGNRTVTLQNVRPPARTLTLSAEAMVDASAEGQRPTLDEVVDEAEEKGGRRLPLSMKPVAIVFGPENGAVSEKLVYEAGREAHAKSYTHLYVIGFAIQPNARELVENSAAVIGVPATYIQATPDLLMGDLLKNMRSSQIFSVCGLPEIDIETLAPDGDGEPPRYQVTLLGLDVIDPATMKVDHRPGNDVPCWFLDTDHNDRCFRVCQAFFPRTGAWSGIQRALKADYDESVWDHLAGTTSAPFYAGEEHRIAVKVIDDRGNELLVTRSLDGSAR